MSEREPNRAFYILLDQFNAACSCVNANYFAVGNTLIGAVVYGDLIPEDTCIELGILREEYSKLTPNILADAGLTLKHSDPLNPIIIPHKDTTISYSSKPVLFLHIFDYITNDYDLAHFHVQRVLTWKHFLRTPFHALAAKRITTLGSFYTRSSANCDFVTQLGTSGRIYVPKSDVTTVQQLPFGASTIQAPIKTSCWIEQDSKAEKARTQQIQQACLSIAQEIARVCKKHNIGYFICSGTLLGAYRSKDFIPWDDDIDIGMLRTDYNRFIEVAPSELGPLFFLQAPNTDPNTPYLYSKVRLNNTEYITSYTQYRDSHQGISVDIFPFDYIPSHPDNFKKFKETADALAKQYRDTVRRKPVTHTSLQQQLRLIEKLGRMIMALRRTYYKSISLSLPRQKYEAHVSRYNNKLQNTDGMTNTDGFAVSFVTTYTYIKLDDLLPYSEISFAGLVLSAPKNPEAMLSMLYGTFTEEPPLHKRHSHYIVKWKV